MIPVANKRRHATIAVPIEPAHNGAKVAYGWAGVVPQCDRTTVRQNFTLTHLSMTYNTTKRSEKVYNSVLRADVTDR